jgi:arylsulfatase
MPAGRYDGLPLDDRNPLSVLADPRPQPGKARSRYVYYPDCEPVPAGVGVNIIQRSFDIAAEIEVRDRTVEGVLFAQGSHIGGHTLYVKDGRVHYVYNWLGDVQQKLSSDRPLEPGKHTVSVSFEVQKHDRDRSPRGPARLSIDGMEVASEEFKTQPGFFGLEGVVTVGRDVGRPASDDYESPDAFRGGVVERVTVEVQGPPHRDLETEAKMAHSRD